MKKAVVFLADGLEECEGLLVVDLMRRAGIEVTTASIMGRLGIVSSHNIRFEADALAEALDYSTFDIAVLPGGGVGTENLSKSELVCKVCKDYAANPEKKLGAVCAAPSVLGQLGLLQGKYATCYPGVEDKLLGAIYTGEQVEVSGNIITGKALGATIPFALEMIRQLCGQQVAMEVALRICTS